MVIYIIKNKINDKIYIGKTVQTINIRWNKHLCNAKKHINRYLYDAMNKYGYENFIIEELDRATSIEQLNDLEIYYIKLYKSNDKHFGYNMTPGGDGGEMPLESIKKAKITRLENNSGVWQTKEAKEKMVEGIRKFYKENPKRQEFSQEWKDNIGKSIKTKWKSDIEFKSRCIKNCHMRGKTGSRHHFFGKSHSKKSRKKISLGHLGKTTYEKQKRITMKNWKGNKNPNFKNIDITIIINFLREKQSLHYMSNFFGNISVPGISYKIKTIFNVKSIKDIYKMVDLNTFEDYLKTINC